MVDQEDYSKKHPAVYRGLRTVCRCWLAVRWLCQLAFRYVQIRQRIAKHLGRPWVRQQLPQLALQAASQVICRAWRPTTYQCAVQRADRVRMILTQLNSIRSVNYAITTSAGRRVYLAALTRCLSAICQRPVNRTSVSAIIGRHPLNPTSIVQYLIAWLEEHQRQQLHGHRHLWANPLPSPVSFSSLVAEPSPTKLNQASAIPLKTDQELSSTHQRPKSTIETSKLAAVRKQLLAEQELQALHAADQELLSVMAEYELQVMAIPTAVLEACSQKNSTKRFTEKF